MFVYNCVFGKRKKTLTKPFTFLKMKAHFEKDHTLKMKTWDDYDYDESDDEDFKKLSPLGIDPPVSS